MNLKLILCAFGFHALFCDVHHHGSYASFNGGSKCDRCHKTFNRNQSEEYYSRFSRLRTKINKIFPFTFWF